MNIAVPGTRFGGCSASEARNDRSGIPVRFCRAMASSLPRRQVVITVNTMAPSASGNQPPSAILRRLDEKKAASMRMKKPVAAMHSSEVVAPREANHEEGEDRGHQHRPAHCDAVRGGELRRGAESDDRRDDHEQQDPVRAGNVDLPDLLGRSLRDMHARQIVELDRLLGERVRARDRRLRGDYGRGRREPHQRVKRPLRSE